MFSPFHTILSTFQFEEEERMTPGGQCGSLNILLLVGIIIFQNPMTTASGRIVTTGERKFPLTPMGVLARGYVHARPSARPSSHECNFVGAHVWKVTYNHLPKPLTHPQSFGTLRQLLKNLKINLKIAPLRGRGGRMHFSRTKNTPKIVSYLIFFHCRIDIARTKILAFRSHVYGC
jgi:hypothetical protein